jgi:tRNA-dihydrouridine synthase C
VNLGAHESTNSEQPKIWLAPMEGVVDHIVRDLLTRSPHGVDFCVTEFIRVQDRVLPRSEFYKDAPELVRCSRTPSGIPVLVQLLGGQAGPLAENAALACTLGAYGIDLNFGCPAKTVNRHDGGATLLKTPSRIFDVLKAVRAAVPPRLSVSAKVRLGFSDKAFHLDIAKAAEAGGASWLTVHARTRDEGYRPPAHWEYISRMRQAIQIPVIANGEIWSVADYDRAREISGCRDVMIGRGLLSDPWLARKIKGTCREASWRDAVAMLHDFADLSFRERGEGFAVCRLKQWMKSLSRRYNEATVAFEAIKRFESVEPMLDVLKASSYGESRNLHESLLPVL